MATTAKRAYKLQEFVAHSLSVNCLKIGRKTSRVLVTGGEDHKVNLWSIGKPNAILTLSGHTSAIESVNFDSSEVLVAAGAASGSIKLWDLEEAKIVRTLTGHRSNCISVDFHPFGEFFASGSLDTNLKIWDIRRKGCIHTYKGHTRGVNAIRFTPDGRWVVSGGEDNSVKLWDLTAGKLLHDFKCHEGQIQCIDFHPHEFLLATGSSDKTVKLWDLETFEMVGSSGPETSGVRAMTFNPDGRTLLCGLHESLKVLSWEPMRCHDTVDVGWSKLSDLNIYEGKLLGCSYNQSCVGVWVVDLSQVEPYAVSSATKVNGRSGPKPSSIKTAPINSDNDIKTNLGRLSVSQNADQGTKETKVKQYTKPDATENFQTTPPRLASNANQKTDSSTFASVPSAPINKRGLAKAQNANNIQNFNKPDGIPVIVPKDGPQAEVAPEPRKETTPLRTPSTVRSRLFDFRKQEISKDDAQRETSTIPAVSASLRTSESAEATGQNFSSSTNVVKQTLVPPQRNMIDVRYTRERKLGSVAPAIGPTPSYSLENHDARLQKPRETYPLDVSRRGRTGSLVSGWEHRERSPSLEDSSSNSSFENRPFANMPFGLRGRSASVGKDRFSDDSEDLFSNLSEQHEPFLSSMQCRLTKLQVLHRLWQRKDARGLISAAEKMSDHAVSTDIVSVLVEKCDIITLDLCTSLLPLLNGLLTGDTDRSISISLEMLLKLVRMFGAVISSTVSAPTPVGVDLEAEQRIERCNICFIELQKVKSCLPSLTRKGGTISRSSQELILALQEVL